MFHLKDELSTMCPRGSEMTFEALSLFKTDVAKFLFHVFFILKEKRFMTTFSVLIN